MHRCLERRRDASLDGGRLVAHATIVDASGVVYVPAAMADGWSDDYYTIKHTIRRYWVLRPERIWLASSVLHRRGHRGAAFALKQLGWLIYRNSLHPEATVAPDVDLGHNSMGIVVDGPVTIGRGVKIWHNVTITARHAKGRVGHIIVEDGVMIGAGACVISRRGETLRIGRGARIGANAVVTDDVPPRATVVGPSARLVEPGEAAPSAPAGDDRDAS
jgi:serine O-acetyltransferase